MSEKEKSQLVSEVNILRELRHPNIVRYYDRIIDKEASRIYIVMEYCEQGDMAQLIKRCKKAKEHIPEEMAWKIRNHIVKTNDIEKTAKRLNEKCGCLEASAKLSEAYKNWMTIFESSSLREADLDEETKEAQRFQGRGLIIKMSSHKFRN